METPRESVRKIMHYEQPQRTFNWNRLFGFYKGVSGTQYWHNTVERFLEKINAPIDNGVWWVGSINTRTLRENLPLKKIWTSGCHLLRRKTIYHR
jgi:hypothetical protein